MKEKMERLVAFSFTSGCVSHSSVDVVDTRLKKPQLEPNRTPNRTPSREVMSSGKPKANISTKIQKLIKNLSHIFQFYKIVDEDDEDEDYEMVIGLPTDVIHVGHIGWDGFSSESINQIKSWDKNPGQIFSIPTISLKQFEITMAAKQTDDAHQIYSGPH